MQSKNLYASLIERKAEHQLRHPQPIEIDLKIANILSLGSSPMKVTIDVHCEIPTAYRSIAHKAISANRAFR